MSFPFLMSVDTQKLPWFFVNYFFTRKHSDAAMQERKMVTLRTPSCFFNRDAPNMVVFGDGHRDVTGADAPVKLSWAPRGSLNCLCGVALANSLGMHARPSVAN